ncbi:hypothetical protein BC781_101324 [Sediminitomix flava]|uniref:Uncharacterized protein n=1 Tax=Sediminitomix flava TaxID=379075 RepID=A0A315ZGW7_SEDFL|nr:hypothetical protein BC781_101324 [Sediminitomix flava]
MFEILILLCFFGLLNTISIHYKKSKRRNEDLRKLKEFEEKHPSKKI